MSDEGTTPTNENGQQAPASPETPPSGGGLDFIPEQFRETSWATKYGNDPVAFWNGVNGMSEAVGKKEIVKVDGLKVPGEGATDEERAAFDSEYRKAMGVPEEAGGYELPEVTIPEGLEIKGEFNDAYKAAAHKYGLTPEQVAGLYSDMMPAFVGDAQRTVELTETQKNEKRVETAKTIKAELEKNGKDAREFFGNAKLFADHLEKVDAGLLDRLEKKGLADDPDFLAIAALAGPHMPREAGVKTPPPAGVEGSFKSQAEARAEIMRIKGTKEYRDGDKTARAKVENILQTWWPGDKPGGRRPLE